MKKLALILALLMIVMSFAGCANETETPSNPETSGTGTSPTSSTDTNENPTTSAPKEDAYDNWAKVGGKSIFVNYKSGRRKDDKSNAIVFHDNHTDMIALHYNKADAFNGDAEEAFAFLNNGLLFGDLAAYAEANFYDDVSKYVIEKTKGENKKVNSVDMFNFTGTVTDAEGRVCYVYGYTFVIEGVPCMLAGLVCSEDQSQQVKDAINTEIDTMAETVRTKR